MSRSFIFSLVSSCILALAPFIRKQKDKYPDICVAVGFSVFLMLVSFPVILTTWLHPRTFDMLLYRADLRLGLDPFLFGRFVNSAPRFANILIFGYDAISFVFALAYVFERSPILLRTCIWAPLLAFIGYNLLPAVGPAHAFSGFPWGPPLLLGIPEATPRNCFPSMHLGWAILIALNVRATWLRLGAWLYALLMVFATVGLGEHYFVDLIASVPFCFAVQWMVKRVSPLGISQPKPELAALSD
jgi:hypothetical protein